MPPVRSTWLREVSSELDLAVAAPEKRPKAMMATLSARRMRTLVRLRVRTSLLLEALETTSSAVWMSGGASTSRDKAQLTRAEARMTEEKILEIILMLMRRRMEVN